jgi:hypothetical protein
MDKHTRPDEDISRNAPRFMLDVYEVHALHMSFFLRIPEIIYALLSSVPEMTPALHISHIVFILSL